VAHRIKVARIEAFDIKFETRSLRLAQDRSRCIIRFMQEFAQACPAAMQVRFDGADAAAREGADLVERVTEDVLKNDTAALRHWKPHEGMEARRCCLATLRPAIRV